MYVKNVFEGELSTASKGQLTTPLRRRVNNTPLQGKLSTPFTRRVNNSLPKKAFDDALVAPVDRFKFEKCNMRLKTDIKPKEATFQVDIEHTGDITYLTDVNVDYLHQPWRAFAIVINKCLSGKETGIDKSSVLCSNLLGDQEVLESKAYQTYYAFAFGEKAPKPKYVRKKADPYTSPKQKPIQATKGTRIKTKSKVAKSDKKKQQANNPKAKGLTVLSKVALTEAEQLKLATKRSKTQFHCSYTSGSDNDEEDDDEDDFEDDDDSNDNDGSEDHNDDSDDKRTESDSDEILDPNKSNEEHDEKEEEYDDEFNVKEGEKMDKEEDDEGGADQQNASQQSGFKQEEEYAHVTLTLVLETQKTRVPSQNSSIASDFTSELLNLDNPSPTDTTISSLMYTTIHYEITSATTIPLPPLFFNPLQQEATPTPTPTTSEATTSFTYFLDFAFIFKFNKRVTDLEKNLSEIKQIDQYAQALSSIPAIVDRYMDNKLGEAINKVIQAHNFDCIEEVQDEKKEYIELVDSTKNVAESLEAVVLTRSSSQPQSSYEAAATLSEFELIKILIDKIEKNKSFDVADYKRELYDALVKSYNTDKDIFEPRDKKRKSSKDVESSRDSKSTEKKSSSTSKDASQSQNKSSGKSAHAEEPSYTVEDSGMQQDKEFVTGDNDEQPVDKEVTKADWFKKPERPPTPDRDWSKRQDVDFRPPQTWISQVARTEEPSTSFDELNDTSFDFSAFVMNWLKIPNLTQEILVGLAFNFFKGTCKSTMELEYHLEECSKASTERLDWHNTENKPLTNLKIDEQYDLNVALRIHTRRIVIQRRVEDLQLGFESYQKKLNLTKPDTYRSNLRNKTAYTYNSDPHGIIYVDQYRRKRLMRADELYKFSDDTLNDVRSALHDIAAGIRMKHIPMRKWSNLDKKRAQIMI
uniref:Uncharacterized protein n=1 Tax=Tanacetum cinerariifolium TaxID=118510 RepID=A0A6L2MGE2_TANCI|nr:hypothetical protein [Tanacetum cinerariifolium]